MADRTEDAGPSAEGSTPQDRDQAEELRGKLFHSALWVAGTRWGIILVTWPITIALGRLLTPQDYGYLALVSVFTRFASLLAEGGIASTVVLGEELSSDNYRRLHGWSASFYLTAFTLLLLAAVPVEHLYDSPGLRWILISLSVTVAMEGFTLVPVARMRRDLRLRELAIFGAVLLLTNGIVALACALAGMEYWSLVVGYVSSRAIYTFLVLRAFPFWPSLPRLEGLRTTLRNARRLLVASVSTFLGESSDAWVGALAAGTQALGGYTYMTGLARAPLDKVSGILMYVAGPALGNIRDDTQRLLGGLVRILRLTSTFMFPIFVGIVLVGEDFVQLALGDEWMPFVPAMQVYCVYAMFLPMRDTLRQGAVAAGAAKDVAGAGLMLLFLLPPGFFLLGSHWGATGLALAWLLPVPFVLARLLFALRVRIGLGPAQLIKALWTPFVNVAIMALVVTAIQFAPGFRDAHPLLRLVLQTTSGAATYLFLVFRLQSRDIVWMLETAGPTVPTRLQSILRKWTRTAS